MKKDFRQMLLERTKKHANNSQNKSNNSSFLNAPEGGVEFWFPEEEGDIVLNILPYIITKDNHPDGTITGESFAVGDPWYRRPYGLHFNVGPNKKKCLCPKFTFGKHCPICDEVQKLCNDYEANKELIGAIRVKKYCLFNATVGESKKIRVFDWSYSKFAEVLEKEITKAKDPGAAGFAMLEDGRALEVRIVEDKFGGKVFLKTDRIDFSKRPTIPESVLEKCPKLDDLLKEVTAADIRKLMDDIESDPMGMNEEAPVPGVVTSAPERKQRFKSNVEPPKEEPVKEVPKAEPVVEEESWDDEPVKEEPKPRRKRATTPAPEPPPAKEEPKKAVKEEDDSPFESDEAPETDDESWDDWN